MSIAEAIKDAAFAHGVSYEELAAQTGLSRQSVYRKLNGLTPLTLGETQRLCTALGLSLSKLMRQIGADGDL